MKRHDVGPSGLAQQVLKSASNDWFLESPDRTHQLMAPPTGNGGTMLEHGIEARNERASESTTPLTPQLTRTHFEDLNPKYINPSTVQLTVPKNVADLLRVLLEHAVEFQEFIRLKRANSMNATNETKDERDRPNAIVATEEPRGAEAGSAEAITSQGDMETSQDQSGKWIEVGQKRRKTLPEKQDGQDEGQQPPTQTVVLRSTCKEKVTEFKGREIQKAIEKTGISNKEGISVHVHPKANTIAITTKNPLLAGRLMNITEIPRYNGTTAAVTPYKALSSNQCRGVIYLRGGNNQETPETLVGALDCKTHRIVAARPLGKTGSAILVTFEGKAPPARIRYCYEILKVAPYNPRPLVCYNCHDFGHKADVCPNPTSRCGICGQSHDEDTNCNREPLCYNCGGAHAAVSADCPKRSIPPRRKRNPARRATRKKNRQPNSQEDSPGRPPDVAGWSGVEQIRNFPPLPLRRNEGTENMSAWGNPHNAIRNEVTTLAREVQELKQLLQETLRRLP